MKPTSAFIVFAMLMASAVGAGIDSLLRTQRLAETDVERALAMTLVSCQADRIDADTIRVYRDHISMDFLRDTAYLAMSVADDDGRRPTLTAHTGLTPLRLWQLSDQRASGVLTLLAALWLAFSLGMSGRGARTPTVRPAAATTGIGSQADLDAATPAAVSATPAAVSAAIPAVSAAATTTAAVSRGTPTLSSYAATPLTSLHLTPMQRQLVEMFLAAPDHRLLQHDICERLWPKKPDASATLYTLIRRIKPTLAEAGMRIECERGQAYCLVM